MSAGVVSSAWSQHTVELHELRREVIDRVSLALLLVAGALLFAAAGDADANRVLTWGLVAPLLLTAALSRFERFGLALTSALVISGLFLSVTAAVLAYPTGEFVYALCLPIIVTGVLLGGWAVLAVAAVALLLALGLDSVIGGPDSAWRLQTALFVLATTAVFSWLSAQPVRAALDWTWRSYLLAQQRTDESRSQRGELVRLTKSLNETCIRLEEMNWELERARRTADEARRLKSEFAAMISHELRTPINLIIGFSEMMIDSPGAYRRQAIPPAYRQDLEAIHRSACQISQLIADVLDLSQVEAHRLALERSATSIADIAEEAVATFRSHFERLGLRLEIAMPPDLPILHIDANRVRQILINLLNNAARFTDRGGVTISAHPADDGIVVTVKDTGAGIATADLPYVFQDFYQAGPPDRRRDGSGLGLAICRRFAEMHGGNIWVESELGNGSAFHLLLPFATNVVSVPTVLAPAPRPTSARNLFVLGREPDSARVLQRYLDGYRVVHAADARSLRSALESVVPHALALADSSAAEIWRNQLASEPRLRDLPVFTCVLGSARSIADALGVAEYLVKPLSRADLASALRRAGKSARDVLLVDDDPDMLRLVAGLLRTTSRRYQIRQAGDGAEALRMAREHRPDVVLLDLQMPGITGLDVLRELRLDPALRDVVVMVLTGQAAPEEAVRLGTLGLTKVDGLSVGEMVRCLRASLEALLEPGQPDIPAAPRAETAA